MRQKTGRKVTITDEQRHTLATLLAADHTLSYAQRHHKITSSRAISIISEEGWQALLQSKREAIHALMVGVA